MDATTTGTSLEAQVGAMLLAHGWTVCTAESCTGGLVAHRLTDIAGSSAYMLGGAVTYSNEMKMKLLGVQESTLIAHGAVSEETAVEMARGALALFGANLAVSITGIAGPGGGSAEKPVGLTYFAAAHQDGRIITQRQVWPYSDRARNKAASADCALQMLLELGIGV